MDHANELLAEMMLHAAQFCHQVENLSIGSVQGKDLEELRLKLSQARNTLERLQDSYNEGLLDVHDKRIMAQFREILIALLWIIFYVRRDVDFKVFRMVVAIDATFTHLLLNVR